MFTKISAVPFFNEAMVDNWHRADCLELTMLCHCNIQSSVEPFNVNDLDACIGAIDPGNSFGRLLTGAAPYIRVRMIDVCLKIRTVDLNFCARADIDSEMLKCIRLRGAANIFVMVDMCDDRFFPLLHIRNSRAKSLDIAKTMQGSHAHISDC